jgi:hypothetical protein
MPDQSYIPPVSGAIVALTSKFCVERFFVQIQQSSKSTSSSRYFGFFLAATGTLANHHVTLDVFDQSLPVETALHQWWRN